MGIIKLIKNRQGEIVIEESVRKALLFFLFVFLTLGVYYLIRALINF